MKQRKTIFSILSLLVILALLLSGCGQQAAPTSSTAAPQTTATAPSTPPATDPLQDLKTGIVKYYNAAANSANYIIAPDKLKSELDNNSANYLIIDVRKAPDYSAGHIKGAINVPYGVDIATNLDKIRAAAQGKTAVVYCYTGQTAAQVNSLLNLAGIKTLSVNGGMGAADTGKGWLGAKLPVEANPVSMPSAPAVESPNKDVDQAVRDYFLKLPQDSNIITGQDLHAKLATGADSYVFIDIRKPEDFAKGHIKGALNFPYGAELAKNLDTILEQAKGKNVIVNCVSGQTAGQTIALFHSIGINAKSLRSGFDAGWGQLFPNEVEK